MQSFKPILTLTFTFLFLIVCSLTAYAQSEINENDMRDMVEQQLVPTIQKTEVEGTPYYTEDFTNGSLELYNGNKTEELTMNFNIYENRVEYQYNGNTYAVSSAGVRHFNLTTNGEDKLFKKGFESRRLDANEFVEVVVEGPISFLIKHEVNFTENSGGGYGSATQKSTYSKNERYYLQKNGETIYLRRPNNRRVSRHFDGNKEVEAYIEEQNLDLSEPQDIAKAVTKYNNVQ